MKVLLSHPTGNANVRAAARGLFKAGMLSEFRTSIATFPGSLLDNIADIKPLAELRRRSFDADLQSVTKMWPWIELGRMIALKGGISTLTKHETGLFSVDAVYRSLDKLVAGNLKTSMKHGAQALYCYEDCAKLTFKTAKSLHLKCLYDLPIGYWRTARKLLEQDRLKMPEWASTLTGLSDSQSKLASKDEELRLADTIFVASRFTAKTLEDFQGKLAPVKVIPYGFPSVNNEKISAGFDGQRPLKVLFVGGLSQRKGIAYLFEAVSLLGKRVELTIVGSKASEVVCEPLNKALSQHKWIPSLANAEILKLMKSQDVLVFPSLFEGFGLVITEAMSQGTPVITTDRTAGPDLISNGENGWLIEAGSTEAIRTALEEILTNPESILKASIAARETARKRTWEAYGLELAEAIKTS